MAEQVGKENRHASRQSGERPHIRYVTVTSSRPTVEGVTSTLSSSQALGYDMIQRKKRG